MFWGCLVIMKALGSASCALANQEKSRKFQRLLHGDSRFLTSGLTRCWEENRHVSPIWHIAKFSLAFIRLDWLHIVDLGVAADMAGNILLLLQTKMTGASMKSRLSLLFSFLLAEYQAQGGSSDRLAKLPETTIRKMQTQHPSSRPRELKPGSWCPF